MNNRKGGIVKTENALRVSNSLESCLGFYIAIEQALNRALSLFGDNEDWKGRHGGYLCMVSTLGTNVAVTGTFLVGEIVFDNWEKYLELCQEKVIRLGKHLEDCSSWMSRNQEEDEWGGAVRYENHLYSFSGLSELGDEAVVLAAIFLAKKQDNCYCDYHINRLAILVDYLNNVARHSNNIYFDKLLNSFLIE